MAKCTANIGGIEICYETLGDPSGNPLLLIMGLGGPMHWWDDEFCQELVDREFFVIRYDNRDCGRSAKMSGRVAVVRTYFGLQRAPYGLRDMADDAAGLLDHLGIEAAHVAGVSMGAMIAQTLAIKRPQRVLSLTSIMSTTGNRLVGFPNPRALARLFGRGGATREEYIQTAMATWRVLSADYPLDLDRIRDRAGQTFDLGLNPAGYFRHVGAVASAPDRTRALGRLRVPALVVHGTKDPLVHVSGGRATARAIPGAELLLIEGMGHDLPPAENERITDAIARTADRAKRRTP